LVTDKSTLTIAWQLTAQVSGLFSSLVYNNNNNNNNKEGEAVEEDRMKEEEEEKNGAALSQTKAIVGTIVVSMNNGGLSMKK